LLRIYDPVEGKVTIDDQDVSDLKFESFRKYITVIPQNGALFNDTILFNLQYSNPDATLKEIQDIAKKCKIHDKIIKME
jgi:ABC-type multidrug transport system fused ATPase/permease subunit